jgi:glutaredoxin
MATQVDKLSPMTTKSRNLLVLLILLLVAPVCWWPASALGAGPPPAQAVSIYLFWAQGCPHCQREKEFLARLTERDQNLKVSDFEITKSRDSRDLLKKVGELLHVEVGGVPFTVVGNQYVIGWLGASTSGRELEAAIRYVREHQVADVVAPLIPAPRTPPPPPAAKAMPETLTVPLLGEIELKYLSLGLITVIIGLLDGFNPCAMWVLVFLINLLLGMADRRRMWLLGSIFIFCSGLVYFLFMTAWLNLLLFVGFIVWVRISIGLVALFAGGYNLREYLTNKAGSCKLSSGSKRQKRMDKIRQAVHSQKLLLAIIGIILLALAINFVELICSAGFPVIYLQILSLTPMPFWQYYLYLLLYIFLYMLDDIIVFIVAMVTLELIGITTQYKRASHLIGGVLMLIIGLLLIFKPEVLMFG